MYNKDEINTFLDNLHPKLLKRYEEIQRKSFSENKAKFEKNKDDFIKEIHDRIADDKEHRDVVNLCVFPFSKSQSDEDLEYKFIRAEPLRELRQTKNLDFLLCNFKKKFIIFGECKSSISSTYNASYKNVVEEAEERKKIVEDNLDYIIRNYLGFVPKHIEYVIGVYSSDDEGLVKEIFDRGSEFTVWSIDRYNRHLSFRSFLNISEEDKRRTAHNHTILNRKLNKLYTNVGAYDMFPSSHAITKLRQIILTKELRGRDLIVSPSKIKEKVEKDLFYLDEDYHTDISSKIIDYAEDIGFIEAVDENPIEYRIVSSYRHEDGLEKDLIKKYIRYKIDKKEKEILAESKQIAKEIIETENAKQSTFTDF